MLTYLIKRPVLCIALFAAFYPLVVSLLFAAFYANRQAVPFVGGDDFLGVWIAIQGFTTLAPPLGAFFLLPLRRGAARIALIVLISAAYVALMVPLCMAAQYFLPCLWGGASCAMAPGGL